MWRSHSIPLDRIYSGVIFLAIGAIVLLLFFDIKARKEESWLNHKFPDYDSYRSNVKKLIPLADVFVQMPGASAKEIEQRVTFPLEKLIKELPGVEYVYSTSRPGSSLAIVRFLVGQKTEDAIVQLYNKLYANLDKIPPGGSQPLIKSRSIDDVPILSLTLWSESANAAELRQIAAQLDEQIKQVPNVSETTIIGGQKRQLRVDLDPIRLNSFGLSPLEISQAFQNQNAQLASGAINQGNKSFLVRTQSFVRSSEDAQNLVVTTVNNQPVYLRDVATITDGAEEPASYVFYGQGKADAQEKGNSSKGETDAVTIAVAKRPGANAIAVSHEVLHKLDKIKGNYLSKNVHLTLTRDYGETAAERSNELLVHMAIAVVSVTVLMWFTLGKKEAGVVAVSIPVTLALTLASFVFYGFTLNRVTFFAPIFSIGILVDDAIVVVENVGRHMEMPQNKERLQVSSNRRRTLQQIVLEMARYLRGFSRFRYCLCRRFNPDLCSPRRLVPILPDSADYYGSDSLFFGGNYAGTLVNGSIF